MKFRLRIVLRTAALGLSAVWFAQGSLFRAAEVPVNLPPSKTEEIFVVSPVVSVASRNDEYFRGVATMAFGCGGGGAREEGLNGTDEAAAGTVSKLKFKR